MAKIGILGAGAWGLSVALKLANPENIIQIWAHSKGSVDAINNTQRSKRLVGISLPEQLKASTSIQEVVADKDVIIVAVASAHLESVLDQISELSEGTPFVILSKGLLDNETSFFISDLCLSKFPSQPYAVLSGPNIALEIAQGKPAASVLACTEEACAVSLQTLLSGPNFRVYRTRDVRGVECGGIFKNVIAIAAGICDGLNCGDNAKSALMTRGLGEIQRVAHYFGGRPETINGLSGLGDMMTTCLSSHSRNRSFGESCANADLVVRDAYMNQNTVEGQRTIKLLVDRHPTVLADCPIMSTVYDVLYRQLSPEEAIQKLMLRNLIPEADKNG